MKKKLLLMLTLCLLAQWSVAQAPKWVDKAKRAVFSVVTYDQNDKILNTGKDPNKPAETNSDGSADEVEKQKPVVDAEPGEPAENTGTELVVWPEDAKSGEAQEKDDPEPEEGEPKTPDTQKPVEKAAEDEDDDKDIMTYEANTASTLTKVANEAVQNIIKIINNCTKKDTTVTIENVEYLSVRL